MFKKHITKCSASKSAAVSLRPSQVSKAYYFPAPNPANKVAGILTAVVELGGAYTKKNIFDYCDELNVAHPILLDFCVDGSIQESGDADGEVELDQCVIADVVPGVQILTVFGPNSDTGFVDAIKYAASQNPCAISISWGASENHWTPEARASMDAAFYAVYKTIGVYAAAGDNGSSDGQHFGRHVDYPASSPYVTGCGGTRLILNTNGSRNVETVWDWRNMNGSTGGGLSSCYAAPTFQHKLNQKHRAVPDFSGNADPVSGYIVRVDDRDMAVGGTSAVAPLMSALHAILQTYFDKPLGNLNQYLYDAPASVFFDVVSGSNGAYSARSGFDFCTGLGIPDGTKLLQYLQSVIK